MFKIQNNDIVEKIGIPCSAPGGRNDRFYMLGGPVGSVVEELAVFSRWGEGEGPTLPY